MTQGINRVVLLGNIGADPELKATQGGLSVLKLRLATTEKVKDKSGEWVDRTEWHTVVVWGKRAEGLSRILERGSTILVEGSIHTSSWEVEGQKRFRTEINATNVVLAGGKRQVDGEPRRERSDNAPRRERRPQTAVLPSNDDAIGDMPPDDSLPF
jgi:single-strand DNA-binding protein